MDLFSLIENLDGIADVRSYGLMRCRAILLKDVDGGTGIHACHDGAEMRVYEDRIEHLITSSSDRSRNPFCHDQLDLRRIQRLRWIVPLISGQVPTSSCWEVADGKRTKRLYMFSPSRAQPYVVWLDPLRQDKTWKLSSAYLLDDHRLLRRYVGNGIKIASFK